MFVNVRGIFYTRCFRWWKNRRPRQKTKKKAIIVYFVVSRFDFAYAQLF